MRFSHLEGLSASWVRGFIPVPEADKGPAERQAAVATLLDASKQGYGTILSLKFPYQEEEFPRAGSRLMGAELTRVEKVLRAAMGKVDILTIGNEPFLESQNRGPALNAFYEHVAQHVIAYRKTHFKGHCRTRLYMGALNHLDDPEKQTESTERWLTFVHDTPQIEGVDIHPHVASLADSKKYLDHVVGRLRDDQKFLATEFSLVLLWEQHMADRIPARFAERYDDVDPETRVWQLLKAAVAHPFPQEKWNAFLALSPWFNENRHYLRDQVRQFRETGKLAVATYGVVQADAMVERITAHKKPWMLNSLYATRTVQKHEDGTAGRNQSWFKDFRELQRASDRRPVDTGETPT
ncbi:hypothetical protein [Streptomyces iconiensis]|uniref:Uncharacterized protein n=1 Tax=Streptomyces iconiensis TaxID=1384038 RepID=A0ABT6ZYA0_9ACTN|nr:hypothetical protein [Streptomyces iconiensis]MDJ1134041.1 hypothetical protein [Streptomyces iconiensis]